MTKKVPGSDARKTSAPAPSHGYAEHAEMLLEWLESDWKAFARALANTPEWGLSGCMMALMPEIQARPELVELLREKLPRLARPVVVKTFEEWLPRKIIIKGNRSFAHIAQALAREHDPDFPALAFDSPRAKCSNRARREGSETTKELIQDGRGWRYYGTAYDYGPGECGFYSESIATAVHPEWTMTVTSTSNDLFSKTPTTFWSTFQPWEKVPETEVTIVGLAEVTQVVGGCGLSGDLVVGTIFPEHGVRLLRDGHVRWQGRFEKLVPEKGEASLLVEGCRFLARLDVPFELRVGDILECFTVSETTP